MVPATKRQIPALIACLIGVAPSAYATDFDLGQGLQATVNGAASLGTMVRTDAPNPDNYGLVPSTAVPGAAPGKLVGPTGGSDLNYARNQPVSTVVKVLADVDVHTKDHKFGAFVRTVGWYDFTLGQADGAYGNYPNRYQTNAPLSDNGFAKEAKFSNVLFRDAFVYGQFDLPQNMVLDTRLGRQVLNWGTSQFLTGGINSAINATDFAALARPGATAADGKLPLGMFSGSLKINDSWKADGFIPYESRATVLPGCGTFYDVTSFVPQGCNLAAAFTAPIAAYPPLSTVASLTEASLINSGLYVHRTADKLASGAGQFGAAMQYSAAKLQTDFRAYIINTASSLPTYRVTVENNNGGYYPAGLLGALSRLKSPTGLGYSLTYPENTRLYGLSFDTKADTTTRYFGEVAFRPNQALSMNASDLLSAFLLRAPNSLLQNNKNILGVAPGGTFDGFDRYGVTTASLGVNKIFPAAMGADRWVVAAEAGISHVNGLPDPSVMRYGRPLPYGAAAYTINGTPTACSESAPGFNGVPGKTCTTSGYISSNAWGVRTRIAATYGNVVAGVTLTPSVYIAKDIKGFSYDGTYSQGRYTVRPAVRADWSKKFFTEVAYTRMGGGDYNLLSDRSNITLVAGMAF